MPKFTAPEPNEEEAFAELADIIATLPRFAHVFAICASDAVVDGHIAHFAARYPNTKIRTIPLHYPDGHLYSLLEDEYIAKKPEVIFLTGMEAWTEQDENAKGNEFTVGLNHARDYLHDTVTCPVVFWCTPIVYNFIRRNAHDFYSIATSTLYVSLPDKTDDSQIRYTTAPNLDAIRSLSREERQTRLESLKELVRQDGKPSSSTNDTEQIRYLHYIGVFLCVEGEYEKAQSYLVQARNLARTQGEKYPFLADLLEMIAGMYRWYGKYNKAKALIRQAQAVTKSRQGITSPEYAMHLAMLAQIEYDLGNLKEAGSLYRQAVPIFEATKGKYYLDFASVLVGMAEIQSENGHYDSAKKMYEESLEIIEKLFGRNHPDTATTLNNMALVEDKLGNYSKSKALLEQALSIWETTVGNQHPDYANTLSNIARAEYMLERRDLARILMGKALSILEQKLGKEHPSTKNVAKDLDSINKSVPGLPENALLNRMITLRPGQFDFPVRLSGVADE